MGALNLVRSDCPDCKGSRRYQPLVGPSEPCRTCQPETTADGCGSALPPRDPRDGCATCKACMELASDCCCGGRYEIAITPVCEMCGEPAVCSIRAPIGPGLEIVENGSDGPLHHFCEDHKHVARGIDRLRLQKGALSLIGRKLDVELVFPDGGVATISGICVSVRSLAGDQPIQIRAIVRDWPNSVRIQPAEPDREIDFLR